MHCLRRAARNLIKNEMLKMNLKEWIELGASFGIIVGLILVGFQMKQNSDLLRTQLLFEEGIAYIQLEQTFLGENPSVVWAKSIESPSELTLEERRIIEGYLWSYKESWLTLYRLSEMGLIEDEWRVRVTADATYVFSNPYAKGWWNNYVSSSPRNELTELVTQLVEESPNGTIEYFDAVLRVAELEK